MNTDRRRFLLALGVSALFAPALLRVSAIRLDYPEHEVREFLKRHFSGSRAFTPTGMDNKERYLTRRFRRGIYAYFERASKSATKLPMVPDPFTGSLSATDYTVGDAKVRVEKAWVPVNVAEGQNRWTVTYLMRNDQERNDDRWRIDDIQDVRGTLLSEVLKKLK